MRSEMEAEPADDELGDGNPALDPKIMQQLEDLLASSDASEPEAEQQDDDSEEPPKEAAT